MAFFHLSPHPPTFLLSGDCGGRWEDSGQTLPIIQLLMKLDSNAHCKGMASKKPTQFSDTVLREEEFISSRTSKSRESCFKPGRD